MYVVRSDSGGLARTSWPQFGGPSRAWSVDMQAKDMDNDNMADSWEEYPWNFGSTTVSNGLGDADGDGLIDCQEYQWNTSPTSADSDYDGLGDKWEVDYRLNPGSYNDPQADADTDGLTAAEEYAAWTDPNSADTDADTLPDGWEVTYGLNPKANDAALDADSDGLSNTAEYALGNQSRCAGHGLRRPAGQVGGG